jgi:predicted dehydrogenase
MQRVKWGVLGCADFARRRAIPAMLAAPSVELIGVASRTLDKAESFCEKFQLPFAYGSYDEMLADPRIDAVYIPLPNGLHAEWMKRAAKRGKHCLCEKPFAANAAEAEEVAEVATEHGISVMEAFMWRFQAQHLAAKKAIERGVTGPIHLIRSAFSYPHSRQGDVRLIPDLAGGSVLDVGCYPISAARFYFAAEPITAYARGDIDPEFGVDMGMSGMLEFPDGRALIDCSFRLPFRTKLEIVGERGTIEIPRPWYPDPEATIVINGEAKTLPSEHQYVEEFEHFSKSLLEGKPPAYGAGDAVRQMRVIDAVFRSMRTGESVRIG